VNLQTECRRTRFGIDSQDLELDLLISPDRQRWQWKDEKEFASLVDAGVIGEAIAREIRSEGEALVDDALAGRPPFDRAWKWRPQADVPVPTLPAGWSRHDALSY
jgi:hypothetical protein